MEDSLKELRMDFMDSSIQSLTSMSQCITQLPSLTNLNLTIFQCELDDFTVVANALHDLKHSNLHELRCCLPHGSGNLLTHLKCVLNATEEFPKGSSLDEEGHV